MNPFFFNSLDHWSLNLKGEKNPVFGRAMRDCTEAESVCRELH